MKHYTLLLITLFFSSLLFQGCEDNEETEPNHPPVIGSAVSIMSDDKQAQMAPSTQALNEISQNIVEILKLQLKEIEQQESANVLKTIEYCDISGLKEWESTSNFYINYEACQTEESFQEGALVLTYEKNDEQWLYPEALSLQVSSPYTFNDIVLEENLSLQSSIQYNASKEIENISFIVTGLLHYDYQNIQLEAYLETITF